MSVIFCMQCGRKIPQLLWQSVWLYFKEHLTSARELTLIFTRNLGSVVGFHVRKTFNLVPKYVLNLLAYVVWTQPVNHSSSTFYGQS